MKKEKEAISKVTRERRKWMGLVARKIVARRLVGKWWVRVWARRKKIPRAARPQRAEVRRLVRMEGGRSWRSRLWE